MLKTIFRSGEMPINRVEAFSDGVIAIVVTILVLEIHFPVIHGPTAEQIASEVFGLLPKIGAYIVSFIVLSVWWVAHYQLVHRFKKADRGVLWLNCLFLMFLAFIPFPTALIGEYPGFVLPSVLYGLVATLTGISFWLLRWYATTHAKLINVDSQIQRYGLKRGLVSPIAYALATILAIWEPKIAVIIYGLIPLYYFLPGRQTVAEGSGN